VIKEKTGEITLITQNIPDQLTERPQWVCWRLEERKGEPTKVPYTPGTRSRASSTDLMTWRTFEEALEAYETSEPIAYDGIGFVFCSADPFVGIDLDKCRDPESGQVAPWAQSIITRVREGYVEASPSGTGVHIIVEGTARGGRARKKVRLEGEAVGEIEMYGQGRFFTITGEPL
jgi:primase-polymerase (primpol)-like protein